MYILIFFQVWSLESWCLIAVTTVKFALSSSCISTLFHAHLEKKNVLDISGIRRDGENQLFDGETEVVK